MRCPECGSPFFETLRLGVRVNHCPLCGGIWFDPGDPNRLVRHQDHSKPSARDRRGRARDGGFRLEGFPAKKRLRSKLERLLQTLLESETGHSDDGTPPERERPMNCPRCSDGSTLMEVVKHTVTLDACTSCGGIWLDKGELAKILGQKKEAESELDREFQALHTRPAGSHHGHKRERPKSKREKFFDIFDGSGPARPAGIGTEGNPCPSGRRTATPSSR